MDTTKYAEFCQGERTLDVLRDILAVLQRIDKKLDGDAPAAQVVNEKKRPSLEERPSD